MQGNINRFACGLVALLLSAMAAGEEVVVEFSGTGNRTTAEFQVDAPWILDWIINSDYDKMVSFDLDLVDATGDTTVPESNALIINCIIVKDPNCKANTHTIHFGQDYPCRVFF